MARAVSEVIVVFVVIVGVGIAQTVARGAAQSEGPGWVATERVTEGVVAVIVVVVVLVAVAQLASVAAMAAMAVMVGAVSVVAIVVEAALVGSEGFLEVLGVAGRALCG